MQQLLEITCITLCTVIDKNLIDTEMHTTRQEVVLQDCLAQEVVALFGTIASETLGGAHLVGSLMHSLDDSWCERACDITYTEADDIGLGVHYLEGVHLLCDISEQVVLLKVQEVDVY